VSDYREKCIKAIMRLTRRRAILKGIKINIDENTIRKLWDDTNGRCVLTEIEFSDKVVKGSNSRPFSPSLDRISSSGGYTKDNVRLVCQAVNMALFVWGDEVFDRIVTERNKLISKTVSDSYINTHVYERQVIEEPDLVGRGRCETTFHLPTGWFAERSKYGMSTPTPEKSTYGRNGWVRHLYDLEKASQWLKENPDAIEWTPPGKIIRQSDWGTLYYGAK